jgi:hypothetical protein
MLRAFIDDSGSGGDSTYYVLAGYLSSVEDWDRFSKDWSTELGNEPSLEYFKSVEAEGLKGCFDGFTKDDRNVRIDRLIAIIRKRVMHGISIRMRQDNYNQIIRGAVPTEWDDPYFFMFAAMVSAIPKSSHLILGAKDKIDCVFDRQGKGSPGPSPSRTERKSSEIYERVRDLPGCGYLGNIDHRDDKDFVPLQSADLFAWQSRRFWSTPKEPKRDHFEAARSTRFPAKEILLKKADLQQIVDLWAKRQLEAERRIES